MLLGDYVEADSLMRAQIGEAVFENHPVVGEH